MCCTCAAWIDATAELQKVNGMSARVTATCPKTIVLFVKTATRQVQANKVNAKSDFTMAAVESIVNLLRFVG